LYLAEVCSLVHKGSWDILLFKTHSDLSSGLIKLSCVHVHVAYVHRILFELATLMVTPHVLCLHKLYETWAVPSVNVPFIQGCYPYHNCFPVLIILLCKLLLRMTQNDCCAWSQLHMCVCVCVCVCTVHSKNYCQSASHHDTLHAPGM